VRRMTAYVMRASVKSIFDEFLCIGHLVEVFVCSNFLKDGYFVVGIFIFSGGFDIPKVCSWWNFKS